MSDPKPKFDMRRIAVMRLRPAPYQPRRTFSQQADLELGLDIKHNGQKTPLRVYPDGDDFVIIAGNRRYNGAKLVGLTELDCSVEAPMTRMQLIRDQLIDNESHQSLSAVDLSTAVFEVMEENKWSQAQLAADFHWSESKVSKILSLKTTIPEVQELIRQFKVSPSLGYALSKADADTQKRIATAVAAGEISQVEAKASLQRMSKTKKPPEAKLTVPLTSFEAIRAFFNGLVATVNRVEKMGADVTVLKTLLK